ncbi:hypothetical protein Ddc_19577 [Ditylenchus destructor]|nr:hypothetical protein Ddc_19577 [Ditylenchus destructor]
MDWMTSKIECNKLSLRHKTLNDHNRMQPWLSENIVANKVSIFFCTPNFTETTAKALADGFLRMGKWVRRKADVNALSMDILMFMIREFQELPADDSRHIIPLMEIAKGRFTAQYFHATFSAYCVTEESGSVLGSAPLYYRFCNLVAKQDILVSIVPAYGYSKVSFERVDCIH